MGAIASQITSLTIVNSTVYPGEDHRKHQSSASLAIVLGIHRGPVNSQHKWPVTQKMFPFDDVIMDCVDDYEKVKWVSKYLNRKISNISRTKSQNLNDPRLVLQLSLPNP